MEFFNSLNLTQIKGGTKLKQGDLGSVLSYSLTDENGQEITSFDNKTAYINLVLDDKIWFTTTTLVDISRVTFRIDKAIPIGLYYLEIKIDDYIFPSDRDSIILIEEGSTPYDLKELVPNYDVNMTLKGILSDLSQKGIDINGLNRRIGNANAELIAARNGKPNLKTRIDDLENKTTEQLAEKANKDEVTNVMTPKGTIAYASLPKTGNSVGWYYYCPDGDGSHGAGNYVWNGTSWYFGGTGDEGYNLLKKDLVNLTPIEIFETSFNKGSNNILDTFSKVKDLYVNYENGNVESNAPSFCYVFISVSPNTQYLISDVTEYQIAYFNNDSFISGEFELSKTFKVITTPSNANKMAFSYKWETYKKPFITLANSYSKPYIVKEDIKDLLSMTPLEYVEGKYVDINSDGIGVEPNFCYFKYDISVHKNDYIRCLGTNAFMVAFRDADDHIINGFFQDSYTTGIKIPSNAVFVYISVKIAEISQNHISITSDYPNEVYVRKDFAGDFTKITDALAYGMEHENTTILVDSGTYDIIAELGDDYFNNFVYTAYTGMGPLIGNGTKLIGTPKTKIVCHYKGNNREVLDGFSPINTSADNSKPHGFTMECIEIECSRVRYAVHDDVGIRTVPYKHIYDRCRITIDNTSNELKPNNHRAIGGGMGICGDIVIKDCYFNGIGGNDNYCVSYHNDNYIEAPKGSILVSGCYFDRNNGIDITDHSNYTEITNVTISNNSFGYPIGHSKTGVDVPTNMVIKEWNNIIRN